MKRTLSLLLIMGYLFMTSTFAQGNDQLNYDQQIFEFTGAVVTIYLDGSMLLQDMNTNQQAYVMLTDDTSYKKNVSNAFAVGNYVTVQYDEVLMDSIILQIHANVITYNDKIPPDLIYPIISGKIIEVEEGILHVNNQIFNKEVYVKYDFDTTFTPGVSEYFEVNNHVSFEIDQIDYTTTPITVHALNVLYNDDIPQRTETQYLATGINSILSYYHPDQTIPLNYHMLDNSDGNKAITFYHSDSKETIYQVIVDSLSLKPLLIEYFPEKNNTNNDSINQNEATDIAKSFIESSPIKKSMLDIYYGSTGYNEDYSSIIHYYFFCTYMSNDGQMTSCTIKVDALNKTVTLIYGELPL